MLKYVVALISVSLAVWSGSEWLNLWLLDLDVAQDSGRLLSQEELALYNGEEDSKGLYLAILGQVFDVEKGRKHYGPDGGYRFFTGRDASSAFVTGDFTEAGLTDDVSDLSPSQIVALYDWLAFYQKDYTRIGKLIGRFYSESGKPTDVLKQVEASLAQGLKQKAQAEKENELYPACNSEWRSDRGGRVWCSIKAVECTETGLAFPECSSHLVRAKLAACVCGWMIAHNRITLISSSTKTVHLRPSRVSLAMTELSNVLCH